MSGYAGIPPAAVFLPCGDGRAYEMGALRAVFKADGDESQNLYCVSEWWLEPNAKGPGAHLHDENHEIFYVIEGRPAVLLGETWIEAERGAFFLIPPGIMHDFENRTDARAGLSQRLHSRRFRAKNADDRQVVR